MPPLAADAACRTNGHGISAGLLMRMQLDYNMQQATRDKSFMERLAQIRQYAALL